MDWFRFYSRVLHDPKIQALSGNDFKAWVNLLCLANETEPRGSLPNDADVSFALRISGDKASRLLLRFVEIGLLDDEPDRYVIHQWNKWQPRSDDAATRMANKRRTETEHVPNKFALEKKREEKNRSEEEERREDAESVPSHPFALAYAEKYRQRHDGQRPKPTEHAEAVALEDEHGGDWCFRAAQAFDWQKPPSYLRPWIVDHKTKAAVQPKEETVVQGRYNR